MDWSKPILTYAIINPSKHLSKDDLNSALRYACDQWSTIIPNKFEKVPWYSSKSKADIRINFTSINTPNTLSATYKDGEIRINDDKIWKKYIPDEAIKDSDDAKDITEILMSQLGNVIETDETKLIRVRCDPDSNGNYVLPILKKLGEIDYEPVKNKEMEDRPRTKTFVSDGCILKIIGEY